jgi:UDP-GlcNAc:undecaprenyl-phosphate GlcNAc-1-phosphate transferase
MLLLSRLANTLGLVDHPDQRKYHFGPVPLIGGLAILASLTVTVVMFDVNWPFNTVITLLGLSMFFFGLVDDSVVLSPRFRMMVQIFVALLTVFIGDLHLYYFGDIFSLGDFFLGFWGEALTILAIITAINAFNMIDGIDGLLALLLINIFVVMLIVDHRLVDFYFLCIILLSVFLVFNLGYRFDNKPPRKVFMGDAGSMMFGYMVVCLLIDKSQFPAIEIRPVTVLWIIAIPLMDFVAIVIRRIIKKQPIMKADRDHLHHIFMRMGFSERSSLVVITVISILFSAVGLISEKLQVPEVIMFNSYIVIFFLYLYFILHAWKAIRLFKVLKQR